MESGLVIITIFVVPGFVTIGVWIAIRTLAWAMLKFRF
jgi:hypothetical protein